MRYWIQSYRKISERKWPTIGSNDDIRLSTCLPTSHFLFLHRNQLLKLSTTLLKLLRYPEAVRPFSHVLSRRSSDIISQIPLHLYAMLPKILLTSSLCWIGLMAPVLAQSQGQCCDLLLKKCLSEKASGCVEIDGRAICVDSPDANGGKNAPCGAPTKCPGFLFSWQRHGYVAK